jgi:hypothetical protein
MRPIILAVCVLAAACSGQALDSPTSPVSPSIGSATTPAQGGGLVPFQGSYTTTAASTFMPPITLVISGTAEGTAAQLGRFTAAYTHHVDTTTSTGTGTITFTAANGDWLRADLAGGEDAFIPPNISQITLAGTIVAGTGRFASATGTFTLRERSAIDFAAGTSSGSGSFDGSISLNR